MLREYSAKNSCLAFQRLPEDGKADLDSSNRAYYSSGADDEIVGLTRAPFSTFHPPLLLLFCC